jgi:ribosomal-protein-alanine N-acetyltransferase
MEFEYLETERLQLRLFNSKYLKYVFENYTEPQLLDFFGVTSKDDLTKPRRWYEGGLETYNKKFLFFHIQNKSTNKVIGWCGYHTWYVDHRRAEIGYGLYNDDVKGKGFMSEAMEAILKYGFEVMNLNRIEAFVGPQNIPSLSVMKKFNFTREGMLRSHFNSERGLEDSVAFGLLREEYNT